MNKHNHLSFGGHKIFSPLKHSITEHLESRFLLSVTRPEPAVIRVRDYPSGPVTAVPFNTYVQDVLPNEWPAAYNWPTEAYKTGAVAAKMYGWKRIDEPLGSSFDVYDDAHSQVYDPNSGQTDSALKNTTPAVAAVQSIGMERDDGALILSEYWNGHCSVSNAGSSGLALRPQPGLNNTPITRLADNRVVYVIDNGETVKDGYRWFRVSVDGVYNPAYTGYVAADYLKGLEIGSNSVASRHGQLTQYGSVYWALQGWGYQQILSYFYDGSSEADGHNIGFFNVATPTPTPTPKPTINSAISSPSSVPSGGSLNISYSITSQVSSNLLLGASLQIPGGGTTYDLYYSGGGTC